MTEHAEGRLLSKYGTQDVTLPPAAILATARADYARRARNKDREAERNEDGTLNDPFERYAFLGCHVKSAKSPAGILRAALKWKLRPEKPAPEPSPERDNPEVDETKVPESRLSVLHLTANPDNLKLAIALAEKEEACPASSASAAE